MKPSKLMLSMLALIGGTSVLAALRTNFNFGVPKPLPQLAKADFTIDASHVMVVNASFNGLTVPVVVDTGGITYLDQSIAQQLNLKTETGNIFGTPMATVSTLKVGDAELNDFKVIVSDFKQSTVTDKPTIFGMIGSDFLHYFQTTFNYNQNQLEFAPCRKMRKSKNSHVLPVKMTMPYLPTVPMHINGKKFTGLIDTGSGSDIVLPYEQLKNLSTKQQQKAVVAKGMFACWNTPLKHPNTIAMLDNVRIGDIDLGPKVAIFGDLRMVCEDDYTMALIGKNILDDHLLTLDYQHKQAKLYLTTPIVQDINFSTGLGLVPSNTKPQVKGVWTGSPADRLGIEPGWHVTMVNGQTPNQITFKEIHRLLFDPAVKEIEFKFAEQEHPITIKKEYLID